MSRFCGLKCIQLLSSASKRQFNSMALQMAAAKQVQGNISYPLETVDLQDNDILICTYDQSIIHHIGNSLDCVQGCRKAENVTVLGYKTRIFVQPSIPSQMTSMNNHNIKKIVCCRNPKSAALSFWEWKKNLLYTNGQSDGLLPDRKKCISDYLFSESFGYTIFIYCRMVSIFK